MGNEKLTEQIIKMFMLAICFNGQLFLCAQNQIKFRQLSVHDGLSQNSAISVTQDSIGYLWVATQDGLNQYDGRKFTVHPFTFVDITRSSFSYLGKVYTDKRGDVWIIPMDRRPHKLDRATNTFVPLPGVGDASSIFMDRDCNVWIGTYSGGLYEKKDGEENAVLRLSNPEIGGAVYSISQNSSGVLMLTMDSHIVEFDTRTNTPYPVKFQNVQGKKVLANYSDIVFDKQDREWIGTFGSGLYYRYAGEPVLRRLTDLPFNDSLPVDLNITDLYRDTRDRLWIATYGAGLYLVDFDKYNITHFGSEKHNPTAVHYNDILCIYEDYTGTLWFGTDGAGLSYYDEYLEKFNSFTDYQTPQEVSIDVVRSIAVDNANTIWIGTSGKGLTRYTPDSNSWKTFRTANDGGNTISSDRVMSLLVDKDGDLWIGTQQGGLNIMDPTGSITHFSAKDKSRFPGSTIWCIFEDDSGRIWLGTRDRGLVQFDKKKGVLERYEYDPDNKEGIPSNNIRAITSDGKGNLWIGTENLGIVFFDRAAQSFKSYQYKESENSLSTNAIKSLYCAPNGILWIGTNGQGLNAYDIANDQFYGFSVKDGLANDVIYGILPDDLGNLWLSSNKGITKLVPNNTLGNTPKITNYNNYEGLATEFNTGAYFKDNNGNLYFGGLEGFYWFKPNQLKENSILPKTAITGFDVFNKSYPMLEGQKLKAQQNTISFTFSSLQYALPAKNQYQYRLVNFDTDWVFSGNQNFARYTGLPPGNYQFQVKSSNYDGLWNPEPVSYSFAILSPWYLTPLAKFAYIVLFILLLYGIYRYLIWQWRLQLNLRLKVEETERFKRLNDFKSKLYTDISHEFRTPLSLIAGPVDAKLGKGGLSEMDFVNFSMIKRNINRLISLVDQLLHLARLEKGNLKLKIAKGDLGLFVGMLVATFKYRATVKRVDYEIEIDPIPNAWFDEDALEKIITNLLSNAFKYVSEGGICRFSAHNKQGKLQISVRNSVEEFSQVDLDRLFTRFYQQNEYSEGAGIGLSLVQELVALYQGSIEVKMEDGGIIHFKITLPTSTEGFEDLSVVQVGSEMGRSILDTGQNGQERSVVLQELPSLNEPLCELPLLLIVEDHEEVREFLKSVWADKYRILEAKNGEEGMERALEVVPDLIISDVRMPICGGIALCNKLKTDVRTSHIPIILLTAGIGEELELQGLESGADDFITKPFKLRILQMRVENLIGLRKSLRSRYSKELIIEAKDIAVSPTDEVFLTKLQMVLDEQLSDPQFNAEMFCRKLDMSRMQLHRKLLAYTGLSTTAFIRSQRLKQAVQILKTSDASVSEIAYTVGFNTPSYFIKCFKEVYQKTPTEYLQSING